MTKQWYLKASRMRFSSKIMLSIFPVLLLPFLLIGIFWSRWKVHDTLAQFEHQARSVIHELRSTSSRNGELVANSAAIALTRRDFIDFCTGDMSGDGLSLVKFAQGPLKDLKDIFQSNPMIAKASFYFTNDELYEIWPLIYHAEHLINTPFQNLDIGGQNGQYLVSDGKLFCCYNVYRDVTRVGLLVLELDDRLFLGSLYNAAEEFNCGLAVLSAGEDFCFTPNAGKLPGAQTLLDEIIRSDTGILAFSADERKYYGISSYIPFLDSWVVVLADQDELLSSPRQTVAIASILFFAAMLLLWALILCISRRMLQRLSVLEHSMLRVQAGDLSVRVPERSGGGDELDTLIQSFNRMLCRTQALTEENVERRLAATKAELSALHSQINSHFLYNALENIRMMAEIHNEEELADTIVSLGSLLRYHMTWKEQTVTLQEELACVHRYVHFCTVTGEAKLVLEDQVSSMYRYSKVPKLSIQPLVENAFVHGLPEGRGLLHIRISCDCRDRLLTVCVENDGMSMDEVELATVQRALSDRGSETMGKHSGIGIVNVHRRLAMFYGTSAGLRVENRKPQGVMVYLTIPHAQAELGGW